MPFVLVPVTGRYLRQDGTPAAGTVTFVLSDQLQDPVANEFRAPVPVTATLDGTGAFATSLTASQSTGITPTGATYRVTERISGASLRTYSIVLTGA